MKKVILCIDDTQANLYTLESVVNDMAGDLYDVLTAESAMDGLELLLKNKIDLILLDVMMPEIDGYSAAKMIRSNKRTKNIPIIFLTAKQDDETIEKCYVIGGDDYVTKPFNHIELLSRIAFHIKLKNNGRLLQEEKEYAQSILDLQDSMVLVSDGTRAISVNSALLDFYNLDTFEEFETTHKCVCNTFLKEDSYFNLNLLEEKSKWIEEVVKLSRIQNVLVKIKSDNIDHIFTVKAKNFKKNYIVTLTDITQVTLQSIKYEQEANFDALTKVYNRNMFHNLMDRKISLAKRESKSFVFIILDIDYFKKVNDVYGHLVGDDILVSMAMLIKSHIRDSDIFARWGGEEFVLSFDVGTSKGMEIADTLRRHIQEMKFEAVEHITCSFGLTTFKADDTLESLTQRADKALYEAKNSGRNKVCQA